MEFFSNNPLLITVVGGLVVAAAVGIWKWFFSKPSPVPREDAKALNNNQHQSVVVHNNFDRPKDPIKVSWKSEPKIKEFSFARHSYWNKENLADGPYCSRCLEVEDRPIHMHPLGNPAVYECPACHNKVNIYPERDAIANQFRDRRPPHNPAF